VPPRRKPSGDRPISAISSRQGIHLSKRIIPFAVHEASEYVLGAGLVVVGAHVSGHMSLALYATGGAWCLLGVLSKGRLGVFRLLGRRSHALLDLLLVLALALSPVAFRHGLDWLGVGVGEAVALILARISLWTIYQPGLVKAPSPVSSPPIAADAAVAAEEEEPTRVATLARSAGRGTAVARRGAAAIGPRVSPVVTKGAHRLGRTIGAARRARAGRVLRHHQSD
jgi:hypothetical protein